MLSVRNLRTRAGGPVDLDLARGEIVALRGASGAGKSLLLRALADLDAATGAVNLDGTPREAIQAPLWRRRVALVPAESGWWADRVRAHLPEAAHDAAVAMAEALGLPEGVLDWEVHRLSSGERQRLALVRALARRPAPDVWLLDEPTAALDAEAAGRVEALLRQGRAEGAAILVVTHDAAQAARLADRSLRIAGGRLDGTPPAVGAAR